MPRAELLHVATASFQAARRLCAPGAEHRLGRWHGHGFQARIEACLPGDWAAGADGEALRAALVDALAPLDYADLGERLAEPTDAALAAWIARAAAVPGWRTLTLQSAPEQSVVYHAEDGMCLARRYRFEAAHRLPNVPAGHQCARMHGHGFEVELCAPLANEAEWSAAATLDSAWQAIRSSVDYACLNDIEGLENPTSETIAQWVWRRLTRAGTALVHVGVSETVTTGSRYDGERFAIWKDQRFDAAVQLSRATASDPRGRLHGHSYTVRLTLAAPLDAVLGWVVDFGDVKSLFAPIYRALDHQRLDGLPQLDHADCASVLRWIRDRTAPLLPQLTGIELYERPGCGAKLAM